MLYKTVISLTFGLVMASTALAGGGTSGNSVPFEAAQAGYSKSSFDFTIIPFEKYDVTPSLPPELEITFQLKCFQKFIKIVRHDEVDSSSGKVTIAAGALVREELFNPCQSAQDVTVNAGSVFSGREYEVVAIQ